MFEAAKSESLNGTSMFFLYQCERSSMRGARSGLSPLYTARTRSFRFTSGVSLRPLEEAHGGIDQLLAGLPGEEGGSRLVAALGVGP